MGIMPSKENISPAEEDMTRDQRLKPEKVIDYESCIKQLAHTLSYTKGVSVLKEISDKLEQAACPKALIRAGEFIENLKIIWMRELIQFLPHLNCENPRMLSQLLEVLHPEEHPTHYNGDIEHLLQNIGKRLQTNRGACTPSKHFMLERMYLTEAVQHLADHLANNASPRILTDFRRCFAIKYDGITNSDLITIEKQWILYLDILANLKVTTETLHKYFPRLMEDFSQDILNLRKKLC